MKVEHLGIIPDGNRRWAKENSCSKKQAYSRFAEHICEIIEESSQIQLKMLSIYVISKENLKRSHQDVDDVLVAIYDMFFRKLPTIADALDAQIHCIGIKVVPNDSLKKIAYQIEKCTKKNKGLIVNLLIGYNPVDEIKEAIAQGNFSIEKLSVPKKVDLLIRTAGGPVRLSNFLPLQCGYASIEVVNSKFLDFSCEDLRRIIDKYSDYNPNYGK